MDVCVCVLILPEINEQNQLIRMTVLIINAKFRSKGILLQRVFFLVHLIYLRSKDSVASSSTTCCHVKATCNK